MQFGTVIYAMIEQMGHIEQFVATTVRYFE